MLLIMMIFLFLAGIELLMAKIEFWVMAMLTIPLIGFVPLPQTKFLFESALGAMMNCAIKVCVISFISCLSSGILTDYVKKFTEEAGKDGGAILGNVPLLIQSILVSFILYMMIKKIPALVQGLLSGRPDLGGGASMMQMAKSTATSGARIGMAAVTGGGNMAKTTLMGAAQGAGAGFKAAGGGMSGAVVGAGGAVLGAINGMAGSMISGDLGMAKATLLGGNNGPGASGSGRAGAGGGGGNALADIIQAGRAGAQMGRNFGGGKTALDHLSKMPEHISQALMHNQLAPVFDPKTGQAVYERDANNNVVLGEDGRPKQKMAPTGRHGGVVGNTVDVFKDVKTSFDVARTPKGKKK